MISNRLFRSFLIAAALISSFSISYFRFFELYELQTYDWRCQLRGQRPVSNDIVLIDIWDDTLKALGAWPFDRRNHADLIQVLNAYGAKAIGFDVLFVEPREGDDKVNQAAKEAGNVYFSQAFLNPQKEKGRFVAREVLAPLLESYQKAAKGVGHVNAYADIDGKRRRIFPAVFYENQPFYQLSFRIAMELLGVDEKKVRIIPGKAIELSDDLKIPLDEEGFFIVNFAGKWEKTYQHYSYYDVLAAYVEASLGRQPRMDLNQLKGKVCLIGLTSLGSHDTSPVPIQSTYPMVGLYSNVLNSILQKDFIYRLNRVGNLIILLLAGLLVVWMSAHLKPLWALTGTLLTLVLFVGLSVFLFFRYGMWIDLFYPVIFMVVCYAATTLIRMVAETRRRELIEYELRFASEIQKSFLPAHVPQEKGLDVAVYMKPAKEVGGDLYTFVKLHEGKIGVMVGDVSGKGAPAALLMAKVVSEFKFSAREREDPSQVLTDLNKSMVKESAGGLFVTLAYVIFDVKNRKLRLSSGGHLPMVWTGRNGRSTLLNPDDGMPIGVMGETLFSNFEKTLEEGDSFALYSDGINEARNPKKQEYGLEKLQRILSENGRLSADQILKRIIQDLDHFTSRAGQHDDMTLIIVKVGGGV